MSVASSVPIINTVELKSVTMISQWCLIVAAMCLATTVTVEAGKSSEEEMENVKACLSLANPQVAKCCSMIEDSQKEKKDKCDVKEGEMTCETAKCFLKEDGLDGDNIDEEKAKEKVNEAVKQNAGLKDIGERIKENCLENRRFEQYPPEDCPAASLVICTYLNSVTECPEWKDTDECKKFAEDANICKNAIDSM